ncbi:MAG: c-type cytochrome [Cyclobacteriaceae bacterium]
MKKLLKILGGFISAIVLIIIGVLFYYHLQWPLEYPDTPYPDITASNDSTVIAEGEYLFHAVTHCTACHSGPNEILFADREKALAMVPAGGYTWEMGPIGTVRSANITSHDEYGIGKLTDAEIARTIKYGIRSDHKTAFFMAGVGPMSDQDLTAIVSYLRTLAPNPNQVDPSEVGFLGKTVLQTMMLGYLKPKPYETPEYTPRGELSIKRGEYLANGPGACVLCHSEMELAPAIKFVGPKLSGNPKPDPDPYDSSMELAYPNLTPDKKTGHIVEWTEETFIARFRGGRAIKNSPMPWENFQNMTDEDLASIYRYLMSLEPVEKEIGPSYREVGWKAE